VNRSVAGHHAVSEDLLVGQTEVRGAMRHEPIQLDEGALVEKEVESLASRQLTAFVLGLQPFGTSALLRRP
jgi:hypothetical protein